MVANPSDYITARQAAAIIGVKPATVYGWLRQDPPPFPVARLSSHCVRFLRSDFEAFIASRTLGARAES
jgi:predicted DNA-binding transcriptional regulator AlpA